MALYLYNYLDMPQVKKEETKLEKLSRRNKKIRARYKELGSEPKWYKHEKIMEILLEEFIPLEETTLWLIISKTGYYKNI